MKHEYSYPSSDGETRIHAITWEPEESPRAILQIAHGMVEYIDRYDRFAQVCAAHGICVVGNDHLGHGQSVTDKAKLGYFGRPDGNAYVIRDMHSLRLMTEELYPDVPYFMLGHSMGSYLLRQYVTRHGKRLAGAIIMGTAFQSRGSLFMQKTLARLTGAIRGDMYRSDFCYNLVIGSFNKHFEPSRTHDDWLTRDESIIDSYDDDELCQFHFTVNGYYHMFRGLEKAQSSQNIARIPKSLPMLLVSGEEDPVGDFGKGVKKVADIYRQNGIRDVTCILYPEDRHEILNELDRDKVEADILHWIDEKLHVSEGEGEGQ